MKRFSKKTYIVLLVVLLLFCGLTYFLLSNKTTNKKNGLVNGGPENAGGFSYNSDGTVTLGPDLVANGFRDYETKKNVDQGSVLKTVNGKIKGQVTLQQNVTGTSHYLLILMVDFVQQNFTVNNSSYSSYPFSLEGAAKERIDIELDLPNPTAQEFEYLIFEEPDITELSIANAKEWSKQLNTRSFYSWRLYLDKKPDSMSLSYDSSYHKMEGKANQTAQLTKSYKSIAIMSSCEEHKNFDLVLGNMTKADTSFALIAFLGWRQIPIKGNNMVTYIKLPDSDEIYYSMEAPAVEKNTPYQVLSFVIPYNQDPGFSTLRTIITPSQ